MVEFRDLNDVRAETVRGYVVATLPGAPNSLSDEALRSHAIALAKDIVVLGLSPRPFNALKRGGVEKVFDLATRSPDQLYAIKNLGIQSFDEIKSKLREYLEANSIDIPPFLSSTDTSTLCLRLR